MEPFSHKDMERMMKGVIEPMACDGLRTIGLAYKEYVSAAQHDENQASSRDGVDWEDEDRVLSDMTFLAVLGIQDPVRPEVLAPHPPLASPLTLPSLHSPSRETMAACPE